MGRSTCDFVEMGSSWSSKISINEILWLTSEESIRLGCDSFLTLTSYSTIVRRPSGSLDALSFESEGSEKALSEERFANLKDFLSMLQLLFS